MCLLTLSYSSEAFQLLEVAVGEGTDESAYAHTLSGSQGRENPGMKNVCVTGVNNCI